MSIYTGVNNIAKEISNIYVGSNYNSYRYIRFVINKIRAEGQIAITQISEFEFIDASGNKFAYPSGATVTASMAATGSSEGPSNIIDGNVSTKYCTTAYVSGGYLQIDLGAGNTIDLSQYSRFRWYTANDETGRDPISFSLYFSIDGVNFREGMSVSDVSITTSRNTLAYTGNCLANASQSIARQVTKGYVGVDGVAKLFYPSTWEWGDEEAVGDATWWKGLKNWLNNESTAAERQACIGKTKKVKFSENGADKQFLGCSYALMVCIDADKDSDTSLTFQTKGTFNGTVHFGVGSTEYSGSILVDKCNEFYKLCSAKDSITLIMKNTYSYLYSELRSYYVYAFIPSTKEMGFSSNYNETTPGVTTGYTYYTNNSSNRIKLMMADNGMPTYGAQYYWTRTQTSLTYAYYIGNSGYLTSYQYDGEIQIAPAFVIG